MAMRNVLVSGDSKIPLQFFLFYLGKFYIVANSGEVEPSDRYSNQSVNGDVKKMRGESV